MNLLIKNIYNMPEFYETPDDVMTVIELTSNHQHVLAAFQVKRDQFQIRPDLVLVILTRPGGSRTTTLVGTSEQLN
ncbi:hypothetical protein PI125_g7741 [Phytophthora idaei]|nr:hypothetical protein PI125_g7741 [Phytophthora idaei]